MMDLGPQRVDHGHKPGGLEQQTWIRAQSQTVKPRCGQAALPPKAAGEDPRWPRRFSAARGVLWRAAAWLQALTPSPHGRLP